MPTLDARPGNLDVPFRPGNKVTIVLTGPVGWLASRTYTAALSVSALSVTPVGDALTIVASAAITALYTTGQVEFTLTDTVTGNDDLVGKWSPRTDGSAVNDITGTVIIDSLDVAISMVGTGPSAVAVFVWDGATYVLADDQPTAYINIIFVGPEDPHTAAGGRTVDGDLWYSAGTSVYAGGNATGAVNISESAGHIQTFTLTGNVTFTLPTVTTGHELVLELTQDATGGRTVSWVNVIWPNGSAPIVSTGTTDLTVISLYNIGSGAWRGFLAGADVS